MFNKRLWLNSEDSASTGSVVGYYGPAWWKSADKDSPTAFFEVADCHVKARLHLTDYDTPSDFIAKLRRVASVATELADYIALHSYTQEQPTNVTQESASDKSQPDLVAVLELADEAQKRVSMKFNPHSGKQFYDESACDDPAHVPMYADKWRRHYGSARWKFDPWTGKVRPDALIEADPTGLFIIPEVK